MRGGNQLRGRIKISGSKNSALPILAATILARGRLQINNVPLIRDIKSMIAVLRSLGAKVVVDQRSGTLTLQTKTIEQYEAPYDLVKTMRASILVLGPLVAALGRARVSLPGGCAIGTRPIDIHLNGLAALGADIRIEHGYVVAVAKRLKGVIYDLPFASVGATENLMMAAALAEGKTVLGNVAREPEIVDLQGFINAIGGEVSGAGTKNITIIGKKELQPGTYSVMPDRIEAGTFLVAGAITQGDITVEPMSDVHVEVFLEKMEEAGLRFDVDRVNQSIRVKPCSELRPIRVRTAPFLGFPTDLQAQLMALSCITPGESLYDETIFENRFMHVAELQRLGANIDIDGNTARVKGVAKLEGADVMASDLRASAALVLAGLVAGGQTVIRRVYHIDRGYERFEEKLAAVGADIIRDRDTAN